MQRARSRPLAALLAMGLVTALLDRPARADDLKDRFGSDAANASNVWELIKNGVHFDVAAGVWLGNLSGGLTSLVNKADSVQYSADVTTTALDSVGTGHGLIREVNIGMQVLGNEAYFSYLSDRLFQTASEEVERHVDNPLLRETILQIAGELRPDLGKMLGPEAKVWLKAEYGKFEGKIDNGYVFASRNGKPFFGGSSVPWESSYFGLEAGVYPEGRGRPTELDHERKAGTTSGDEGIGLYGRYRSFSRPVVIGFGTEAGASQFILADGNVKAFEIGVRADLLSCGEVFCARASGYMAPFTGFADVSYENIGNSNGALVSLGGDLRLSLPIHVGKVFAFGPYVGFRMDYLLPLVGASTDSSKNSDDYNEDIEPWSLDYFFWGPTAGLLVQL